MDKNTLEMHTTECDKCDGTGRNYQPSIHELLKRWRIQRGISLKTMAILMKTDLSQMSRFENGRPNGTFGQAKIRRYISMLKTYEPPEKLRGKPDSPAASSVCECGHVAHEGRDCDVCRLWDYSECKSDRPKEQEEQDGE
jgi:transcriptional regulator with XRE-family HTH domain